jgi:hypothetical protein
VRIKPGELYDTALLYLCGVAIWGSIDKDAGQLRRGPAEENRTPDTDRNDCPQVRRSVNVLTTIIVKSHGALIFINIPNWGGLDRDRKAFNRIAIRAFERADVETPRSRLDAGKSHRLPALRTGQDSDFSATK